MTIEDKITDESHPKISALPSGKIAKYEYLRTW